MVEVADLEAAPEVGAHLLGAVAGADDPEPLDALGAGNEVVEEDERPARLGVEGAVEEVPLPLADPRPGGPRVEDAPGPWPTSSRCLAGGPLAPAASESDSGQG